MIMRSSQGSCFLQECRQKWCILVLSILLSAGVGASLSLMAGEPYLLLMRMAAKRHVSIVGTVTCVAPYLVIVLFHSKPRLVYSLCGLRILFFTAAALSIYRSYGDAGWLVSFLMFFPDVCLIPMMILHCIIDINKRRIARACAYIASVGMIYYCWISPFLAHLMDTYDTMGRYAIHVGLHRCL